MPLCSKEPNRSVNPAIIFSFDLVSKQSQLDGQSREQRPSQPVQHELHRPRQHEQIVWARRRLPNITAS